MKNYRVKVRDDKAVFFEELMKYLDFCDYEKVDAFSKPRIYPGSESDDNIKMKSKKSKSKNRFVSDSDDSVENLREVMSKIDAMRDRNRKK
ncbi:hypothetical protein QA597_06640 [Marinilabiliaceae bacterium ANBcel2]|nr:hypothetical protein [Marinilabiliaceae bacterium ANBcel2]